MKQLLWHTLSFVAGIAITYGAMSYATTRSYHTQVVTATPKDQSALEACSGKITIIVAYNPAIPGPGLVGGGAYIGDEYLDDQIRTGKWNDSFYRMTGSIEEAKQTRNRLIDALYGH